MSRPPTYRCLWKARREVFSGTSSNGHLEGYVHGVGRATPQKKTRKKWVFATLLVAGSRIPPRVYDHRLQRVSHRLVVPSFRGAIHGLAIVVVLTDRRAFPRQLDVQAAIIQCQDPAYLPLRRDGNHAQVESARYLPPVRHLAVRYLHSPLPRDLLPPLIRLRGIVQGREREWFAGREDEVGNLEIQAAETTRRKRRKKRAVTHARNRGGWNTPICTKKGRERERMRYVLDIERIQSAVIPNETLETPDQIAIVDGRYVVAIQEAAPPQKLSGAELDTKILYIVHAFVQVGILLHLPLVVVVRMFHPRLVVHDRPVPHPGPHPKRERGGGGDARTVTRGLFRAKRRDDHDGVVVRRVDFFFDELT